MGPIEKAFMDLKKTLGHNFDAQDEITESFSNYCDSLKQKFGTKSSLEILLSVCNKYSPSGDLAYQVFSIADKMILGMATEISLRIAKDERKKSN